MDLKNVPVLLPVQFITDDNVPSVKPSFIPPPLQSMNPSSYNNSLQLQKDRIFNNTPPYNMYIIMVIILGSLCCLISFSWTAHCILLIHSERKKPVVLIAMNLPKNVSTSSTPRASDELGIPTKELWSREQF